jgi:hypothetical protein
VSTSLENKCFSLKEELLLPAEYYLNKIYVAVSRAQKMLVILDSDHGEQAFWKYFKKDSIGDLIADTGISDKDIFPLYNLSIQHKSLCFNSKAYRKICNL